MAENREAFYRKVLHGLNALVTGGTGLIGRQVVDLLTKAGANVKIVSLDDNRVDSTSVHVKADLREYSVCQDVVGGMDCVFHLAGIKGSAGVSGSQIATHFVPTLMITTNVLEACRESNIKDVLFTSSIGAYPKGSIFKESEYTIESSPMDFAGWSKRVGELQIQAYREQYGLNYNIVRPSNVYGPGDNFDPDSAMVIPALLGRVYRGESPLSVKGDLLATRDFVYSRDVAHGILLAMIRGKSDFYNLGSGRKVSIGELVETISNVTGVDYRFNSTEPGPGYRDRLMDIDLARQELGYDPSTSLRDGILETWNWFVDNPDEHMMKQNYFRG